tara:strand:+ start:195 stop:404 length:210 start_codon:yes stop_codon:yes gene_type:complete
MKDKEQKHYEVLNVNTGEWEEESMTIDEYDKMLNKQEQNLEAIEAEYEIVSKIISQQLNLLSYSKESMD